MGWFRRLLRWLSPIEHWETLTEADCMANARPAHPVVEPLPMDRRLGK